ncbi:HD domain-containing protein [Babesia caballi]|uniref:HD domain-containing protein n=1 Tax=Babesia caballi TaxID=5871 RepID=A0AAV4M218_BABCB|nr:HD domain-containing protein [Babesia caballi]
MHAPLICVNIRGQEPLAVEVRSQVSTAKRQIAPRPTVTTLPVEVGQVVEDEGEASKEDLGVGGVEGAIRRNKLLIISRRVIPLLQLPYEGLLAGGESGVDDSVTSFNGTKGSINFTDLRLNFIIVGVVDIILLLKRCPKLLKLICDGVTFTGGPVAATLKDTLEISFNFPGHVVGSIRNTF